MGKILTNNDEKTLAKVPELGQTCEPSTIGKARCEQGIEFQKCLRGEMAKMGIKIAIF